MKETLLEDLQLRIMKVLWANGESSVEDIRDQLAEEKKLAINTIGTVLRRLEEKKYVKHYKESRRFIYFPIVTEQNAQTSAFRKLKEKFFKGRSIELINHLIDAKQLTSAEIDEIKERLERLS